MLHVGLDLSRHRLDVRVLEPDGATVAQLAVAPEGEELRRFAARLSVQGEVRAVIESMNGARFVHDTLELAGWDVQIADAVKVKGLAPLACKTDKIDAFVLAELSRRDLVPAIWLPSPEVRAERERARFRLHLVKHRSALKCRIHASLLAFGYPNRYSDLFAAGGREYLDQLVFPTPWRDNVAAAKVLIDDLTEQIRAIEAELAGIARTHPYVRLLVTAPGIGPVLGYSIASEIGDITRFDTPTKLVGYSGLCPKVYQSGQSERRGTLAKNGPRWLRWALMEAAVHAAGSPVYRDRYLRTRTRLGRFRGPKIARVEVARRLAESTWHMLTKGEPFAPASAASALAS
jgi:transposase